MDTYIISRGDISTIPKIYKETVKAKTSEMDVSKEIVVDIFADGTMSVFEKDRIVLNFIPEATYALPDLVGLDKNGKLRIWKIWTVDDCVYKSYGELGGNLITGVRKYQGVNKGTKNETTPEEQAKREAERDWVKQLDKLYFPIDEKGEQMMKKIKYEKGLQGGTNVNAAASIRGQKKSKTQKTESISNGMVSGFESSILPMHCQPWSEEPKVLKHFEFDSSTKTFPSGVYIQPKLDGVRCIAQNTPGGVVLLSRHGKQQLWLNHIRKELSILFSYFPGVILDGEMYAEVIHGVATYQKKKYIYTKGDAELDTDQRFDVISGAVRPVRNEPHPLEEELSYYIFDIANIELDQDERFERLKAIFATPKIRECPHLKLVPTKTLEYIEEIAETHDDYAQQGYEGVVLRARDLRYESNKRSLKMRKYKYFVEEEFVIVDLQVDPGVEREQFTWVCEKVVESDEGSEVKRFNVKPVGSKERKLEYFDNSDSYIGKLLTVKYQRLSHEGVPLFPVGKGIRDYE